MRKKTRQKSASAALQAKIATSRLAAANKSSASAPSAPDGAPLPRKRGRPSKKQTLQPVVEVRLPETSRRSPSVALHLPETAAVSPSAKRSPLSHKGRGLSVSLVVGQSGVARVVKEEVDVLVSQSPLAEQSTKQPSSHNYSYETGLMERILSMQGQSMITPLASETAMIPPAPLLAPEEPLVRHHSSDSLAFITNRHGYVRVEQLNGPLSPQLPTPIDSDFMDLKKNTLMPSFDEMMVDTNRLLMSPESNWDSQGDDVTDEEDIMDARIAMKKLIDRRRTVGLGLDEFLGSDVLNTPSFRMAKRQRKLTCKACHMTFRQRWILHAHEKKCNIKQTPFLSSDYFDDTIDDSIPYFHEDTRSERSISSPIILDSTPLSRFIDNYTPRKSVIST